MTTLAINIEDKCVEKVRWLLSHFTQAELEVVEIDDIEDLKLIEKTRQETSLDARDFFANES